MDTSILPLIPPTFLAGLLTFLAPCTLPLIPGYLGLISGVSTEDLKNPKKAKTARRKLVFNGLLFMAGFSFVFIVMGTALGAAGSFLAKNRLLLNKVAGIFVILFGLFMVGAVKIPFLEKNLKLKTPNLITSGKPSSSFLLGGAFAFGWTPCIGPILGAVLLLASASATALKGAFLLAVFSAGLAIPFLLIAIGFGSATKYIDKLSKYLNMISIIGGVFLIALGVLLYLDKMGILISYGFRLLEFIGYDKILKYL